MGLLRKDLVERALRATRGAPSRARMPRGARSTRRATSGTRSAVRTAGAADIVRKMRKAGTSEADPATPGEEAPRGRRKWVTHGLSNRVVYGGLHYGARWLPLPVLHGISLVGNTLAVTLMRETLEGIRENFRLALGVPEPDARRLARRLFFEYGKSVIDVWRLRSDAFVPKITSFDADAATLARVRRNGRGFLLVTGHVGNWEMGAVTLRGHALTPAVVGQPELDPDVEAMRLSLRTRLGVESIDIGSSMATAFRVRTAVEAGGRSRCSSTAPIRRTRWSSPTSAAPRRFSARRPSSPASASARSSRASSCAAPTARTSTSGAAARRRRVALSRGGCAPHHEPRGRRSGGVVRAHPTQWFNFYRFWKDGSASDETAGARPDSGGRVHAP